MRALLAGLGRRLGTGRGRYAIVLGGAIGGAVWIAWLVSLLAAPGLLDRAGNVKGGDFVEFYAAGRIVRAGEIDRLYDLDLQERIEHEVTAPSEWSGFHAFITPPFFALPFVPLAALGYLAAFALWSGAGLLLLAAGLWLLGRLDAAPWVLAFVPVWAAVAYGQNSLASVFILTVVLILLERGREGAAGLALGALLYKPQLVVVLAVLLLLERRWRALAGLAAAAALLAGIALAMSVPAALAWIRLSRSFSGMLADPRFPAAKMHSLYGFSGLLLPGHLAAAGVLAGLASVVVLVAVRRLQPAYRTDTLRRWYAVAIWGTVLVSPHVPLYDLSLLVLPALLVRVDDAALWRGGVATVWAASIASQPIAEAMRAAGGPSLQLSVPVIAIAGYCLLREVATASLTARTSSGTPASERIPSAAGC
jgi:alpha-1,2-mannosyltransferase